MVTWTNKHEKKKESWGAWPRTGEEWTTDAFAQYFADACNERMLRHLKSKPRLALVKGAPRCLIYKQLKMLLNFESVFIAFFSPWLLAGTYGITREWFGLLLWFYPFTVVPCTIFSPFYGPLKIHRPPLENQQPGKTRWKICALEHIH